MKGFHRVEGASIGLEGLKRVGDKWSGEKGLKVDVKDVFWERS